MLYVTTTASSHGPRPSDLRVFGDYESLLEHIRKEKEISAWKSFRIYKFKEFGSKPKNIKWPVIEKDLKKPAHIRKWEQKLEK